MNGEKPGTYVTISLRRKIIAIFLVLCTIALGALALHRAGKFQQDRRNHAQADTQCKAAIEKLDAFRFRIEGKQHRCMPCSSECGTLERKLLEHVVQACRAKP